MSAPINPKVMGRAMDTATLVDTRDRVIDLSARFNALEHKVAQNSSMLTDLHAVFLQAQGASKTTAFLFGVGKLLLAGSAGAALWTWLAGHLPKL